MSSATSNRTRMYPNAPHCARLHPNTPVAPPRLDSDRSECTQMHRGAPKCTPISRNGKTNPPPPLTLAQHAAVRYLVRGYRVGQIARHLGVSRHTIKRWKHDPQFAAESERLRREMTAAIVSPSAKATPPPRPLDPLANYVKRALVDDRDDDDDDAPMTDAEAAETEAWIEAVIRADRAGEKIPPPPPWRQKL